jgi:hypothetical protein
MGFVGRKPTNAPLTSDDIPNGIIGAADLATGLSKLTWDSSIKTASTFTASVNSGYFIDTTSNACTVTLPSSATAGDTIILVDYARTWGTNAVTINQNSLNFQGFSSPNPIYNTSGQSVTLIYSGATKGWIPSVDDDVTNEVPQTYSVDFLVIAGGGGGSLQSGSGGAGAGGYRNSYLTETSGGNSSSEASLSFSPGIVYTVTVGAGGAGATTTEAAGSTGVDSSISGTGITTITSSGGGRGGSSFATEDGGSGGGGRSAAGGSGTANQGFGGGDGAADAGGGGGGAGAAGGAGTSNAAAGNGGVGLASSITGSSVTRAGGGGGATYQGTPGTGGTGGGGNGGRQDPVTQGTSGTANTGGGGGGKYSSTPSNAGGSGVIILRLATAKYSGTTTGSPTVSTSGSDTILVFNGSGSITG